MSKVSTAGYIVSDIYVAVSDRVCTTAGCDLFYLAKRATDGVYCGVNANLVNGYIIYTHVNGVTWSTLPHA